MDPRVPASGADLQAQLDAALTLREMTSRANLAVERTNSLVQQLTALQDRLKRAPAQPAASADLAKMVTAALDASTKLLEDDLARPYPSMGYRQYPRLREEIQSLSGSVSRAATRPTDPEMLRMKELQQELDDAIGRLNRIQTDQVGKINDAMKAAPFIQTETVK